MTWEVGDGHQGILLSFTPAHQLTVDYNSWGDASGR
jgi:hypothetical protein